VVNDSTHIAFYGFMMAMTASPDLTNFGSSSKVLPVLLSIFSTKVSNLTATWAVWQSKTGVYPALIYPG